MSDYDLEQIRKKREEEERLEAEARKVEEEKLLHRALEAEEAGDLRMAEKILSKAIYVAPVEIAKETPKLNGGPVFRTVWDFEIVEEAKIPRDCMMPDLVKIRKLVTSFKDKTVISGIRVFSKRV